MLTKRQKARQLHTARLLAHNSTEYARELEAQLAKDTTNEKLRARTARARAAADRASAVLNTLLGGGR